MKQIDINCDIGESFGKYVIGNDDMMMPEIISANVACGLHAGDANVMFKTVKLAKEHGVFVGAHPGYPDIPGFGRRYMALTPEELYHYTVFQIGSLVQFLEINHMKLSHIKPHGKLYDTLIDNDELADAFAKACADIEPHGTVYFLGSIPGNCLERYCGKYGLKYVREVYCDIDFTPEGRTLVKTNYAHVSPEKATERAVGFLKTGEIAAVDGTILKFEADSICVHGDSDNCLDIVRHLKRALNREGYQIRHPSQFL